MKRHISYLLAVVAAMSLTTAAWAQYQLQPLFALDPGSRPYLTTDNNQRGVALNPMTGDILLVNRAGGLSVNILDGLTGADKGSLNVTGISGGTFSLNQIAVAADGRIYAANLVTANNSGTGAFKIYRWDTQTSAPEQVYAGELVNGARWGDNIEIRGSGNGTQILFGQGGSGIGNRIAIFTTVDGARNFTPTVATVTDLALGDSRGGVAFGIGDTFYAKNAGGRTLNYGKFDLNTASAAVTAKSMLPDSLSGYSPIGSSPERKLVAAINVNTAANPQTLPQNVYLFDVSDPTNPVTLDIEPFVSPGIQNLNTSGAVDFANGKLVALDTNNGLRAYEVIPEPHEYALLGLGLAALWWHRRQTARRA